MEDSALLNEHCEVLEDSALQSEHSGGGAQLVKRLPCVHEVPGPIPNTTKQNKHTRISTKTASHELSWWVLHFCLCEFCSRSPSYKSANIREM